MKYQVSIKKINSVNSIENYWINADFVHLLNEFNYPEAEKANASELEELLLMAITDFEPPEAAQILLTYKLSESLSEGQIQNISHEMLEDKVAEEYPDTTLHYDLYNVNQLLNKAYNGKFPNTVATIIHAELTPLGKEKHEIDKEIILKTFSKGLKDSNLLNRLFEEQLNGEAEFEDAQHVIWKYEKVGDKSIKVITSNYWIEKEDFNETEYECEIKVDDED
jgi:hypothetical protein